MEPSDVLLLRVMTKKTEQSLMEQRAEAKGRKEAEVATERGSSKEGGVTFVVTEVTFLIVHSSYICQFM